MKYSSYICMLNDHALDEAGSGGIFLASLNVFKWQLSCVLISIELIVLVVVPHADDKNLLLADEGVWYGNDGVDFFVCSVQFVL